MRPSRPPPRLSLYEAHACAASYNTIGFSRAARVHEQQLPSVWQHHFTRRAEHARISPAPAALRHRRFERGAAPLAAEVPSMLRRSILLGEQHAGARHGARPGAHRLRASCAKVTPAARRHRDMRRERRVASVRTLALIRVASLVPRAATKHSLGGSGTARRESTWAQ